MESCGSGDSDAVAHVVVPTYALEHKVFVKDALQRWHALKISDADQSLVYQLFNAHPDMFTALDDPDWFRLYCGCLRKEKKKLNFMQQLSSFKKKRGRDEGK